MNDEATGLTSDHPDKIKIGALASEAFDFTLANWQVLSKLALIPITASFAAFIIHQISPNASLLSWVSEIVKFCAMGMFAVAVHRFYLLGETPKIGLGMQEIKFILFATLTTALWLIPLGFSIFVFEQSIEALHTKTDSSAGRSGSANLNSFYKWISDL